MLLHKTAHTEENSRYLQACVLWVSDVSTRDWKDFQPLAKPHVLFYM